MMCCCSKNKQSNLCASGMQGIKRTISRFPAKKTWDRSNFECSVAIKKKASQVLSWSLTVEFRSGSRVEPDCDHRANQFYKIHLYMFPRLAARLLFQVCELFGSKHFVFAQTKHLETANLNTPPPLQKRKSGSRAAVVRGYRQAEEGKQEWGGPRFFFPFFIFSWKKNTH